MTDRTLNRRRFLGLAAAGAGVVAAGLSVPAQARSFYNYPKRALNFYNTHTNETVGGTYWVNGVYDRRVLGQFCYILRDFRAEEMTRIDPKLFDVLHVLQSRLGTFDTVEIISGYRSPFTNASLASERRGVARNSYHIKGQAIDIRIPSIPTSYIHRAALSLQAGGVGYYPDSDFVHIDTGPVRAW